MSIDNVRMDKCKELTENLSMFDDNLIDNCEDPAIKNALIWNRRKRNHLKTFAEKLRLYLKNVQNQIIKIKIYQHCTKNRKSRFVLGMPYFKDKDCFPCPNNRDFQNRIREKQYLLHTFAGSGCWFDSDKEFLVRKVIECILYFKEEEIKTEIKTLNSMELDHLTFLKTQLGALKNINVLNNIIFNWYRTPHTKEMRDNMKSILISEINKIENIINNNANRKRKYREVLVRLQNELEIVDQKLIVLQILSEFNKKIDWLQIAMCQLDGKKNDIECKVIWELYLHPNINKKPWTKCQNNKLCHLAEEYKYQNWEEIAKNLNCNRSEYQCCVQFHSKLNDKFSKEKWTTEENDTLQMAISEFRSGNYIPWGKIALYHSNRTKIQIYQHYKFYLAPSMKKGRFSLAEDILLRILHNEYGSLEKIYEHFENRNLTQLRDRLKNIKPGNVYQWTLEEDMKIVDHVRTHGEKLWSNVHLNRTAATTRHRFNTLKKWMCQNPNKSIQFAPRRSLNALNKQVQTKNELMKLVIDNIKNDMESGKVLITSLNVAYVMTTLKNLGYKSKLFKKTKTKNPKELLDKLLVNFFLITSKFPGRPVKVLNNIHSTAERINALLKIFGAKVNFPGASCIQQHPDLDEIDREIIIKYLMSEPNQLVGSSQCKLKLTDKLPIQNHVLTKIPPNLETLVGIRTILLHQPTLFQHSFGQDLLEPIATQKIDIGQTLEQQFTNDLKCPNEKTKNKIASERYLFRKRFFALFKWAMYTTLPHNEPGLPMGTSTINPEKTILNQILKPHGRPQRKPHPKILLMNTKRLQEVNKRKNETEEGPSKRIHMKRK